MEVNNLKPFEKGHKKMGGRKKGTKNASTLFNEVLKKRLPKENYDELIKEFSQYGFKPKNHAEFLVMKTIMNAYYGHTKAMEMTFYYAFGKPTEKMEVDNNIQIEFVNRTKE